MKGFMSFVAICVSVVMGISILTFERTMNVSAASPVVWVDPGMEIPPCPSDELENPPCPTSSKQSDNGLYVYVEDGLEIPPCPAVWENKSNTKESVSKDSNRLDAKVGKGYCEVLPREGDGWYKLANRYGVDVEELMNLNGGSLTIGPKMGQLVKIPSNTTNSLWTVNSDTDERTEEFITSVTLKNVPNTPSWTNATHAADLLNGMIVKSKETFSWWNYSEFPNHCMKADGFVLAPVYPEGTAYGGGICFTSTLLYQGAVLAADMQKVERHSHSKRVIYANSGEDASVTWPAWDNKFKNQFDYDVKFCFSYNTKGEMTVSIYKLT